MGVQGGGPGGGLGGCQEGVLGGTWGVLRNAGIKGIGNCKKCRSK